MTQIDHYEYDGRNHDGTLRIFGFVCGHPVMEFAGKAYWNSLTVKIWPKRCLARHSADVSPKFVDFGKIKGLH